MIRKKESGQNNSVPFPSLYCCSQHTGWHDRCLPYSGHSIVERMERGGGCCLESCQGTGNLPEEGLHAALEVTVRMVGGGRGQKKEREMRRESCRNERREKWGREKRSRGRGKGPVPKGHRAGRREEGRLRWQGRGGRRAGRGEGERMGVPAAAGEPSCLSRGHPGTWRAPLPQPGRVVTPSSSRKMSRAGLGSSVFITPPPPPSSLLARELINIPLWLGRPSPAPTQLLYLLPGSVPGPAMSMPQSSALGSLCSSSWLQGPWIQSLGGEERVSRSQPG